MLEPTTQSISADRPMFCLDTNVVVHALNGRVRAVDARLQQEFTAGTLLLSPSVFVFELRYGIAKSTRREASGRVLDAVLSEGFEIVPFDADDAAEAGGIRAMLEAAGTPIGAYYILIAAQARRRGAVLVTGNRREFERVPGRHGEVNVRIYGANIVTYGVLGKRKIEVTLPSLPARHRSR